MDPGPLNKHNKRMRVNDVREKSGVGRKRYIPTSLDAVDRDTSGGDDNFGVHIILRLLERASIGA